MGQPVMKNLSPMGETRDPARAWGNLWDQLVPFTPGALQARGATAHYLGIWCPWAPGALQAIGLQDLCCLPRASAIRTLVNSLTKVAIEVRPCSC